MYVKIDYVLYKLDWEHSNISPCRVKIRFSIKTIAEPMNFVTAR